MCISAPSLSCCKYVPGCSERKQSLPSLTWPLLTSPTLCTLLVPIAHSAPILTSLLFPIHQTGPCPKPLHLLFLLLRMLFIQPLPKCHFFREVFLTPLCVKVSPSPISLHRALLFSRHLSLVDVCVYIYIYIYIYRWFAYCLLLPLKCKQSKEGHCLFSLYISSV